MRRNTVTFRPRPFAFGGQHLHGRRLGEADEAASSRRRQSGAERSGAAEEGVVTDIFSVSSGGLHVLTLDIQEE